jgi:hypothetical protein
MLRQHIPDDCYRSVDPFREFFLAKAIVHGRDYAPPEFVTALFVNRFIANNGEFMRARRHKNEHSIVFPRLLHPESMKFPLRHNERIVFQLAALDQNSNLTGCFGFRIADRSNDPLMLKFAQEFLRSHFVTSLTRRRRRQNFRRRR